MNYMIKSELEGIRPSACDRHADPGRMEWAGAQFATPSVFASYLAAVHGCELRFIEAWQERKSASF